MNDVKLNLARKWRSKQFSEIIGQELPVRMLKNSLYRDHYFPVYLFSGQRGCGKTTTARVFAAAVNCEQLSDFQKNPRAHILPCLLCKSCVAMSTGKHPDFIEIDAASHTGVDNVRAIIESSSLLPLMGAKKIYLIDEAHMLSKAAFNALLKIMEEPPASVLFILATTDAQKIIETVKSRCFQLFFDPVQSDYLLNHLMNVCQKENIRFDKAGLELIIKQTEGSVRDALNMIEQVRFASSTVTRESVLTVLGHLNDELIIELAQLVITCKPKQLLLFLQQNRITDYRAEYIWQRFMALIHALLWTKYGVEPDEYKPYFGELQQLARVTTIARLHTILSVFAANEQLFSRTTAQHSFLEMILLQLCYDPAKSNNEGGSSPLAQQHAAPSTALESDEFIDDEELDDEVDDEQDDDEELDDEVMQDDGYVLAWKNFIHDLAKLDDPIVGSLLQQGAFSSYDSATKILTISFAKDLSFFYDTLMGGQASWQPLLNELFKNDIKFVPVFDGEKKIVEASKTVQTRTIKPAVTNAVISQTSQKQTAKPQEDAKQNQFARKPYQANGNFKSNFQKEVIKPRGAVVNVSDKQAWAKANLLLSHFPGTVYELPQIIKHENVQLENMQ